MSDNIFHDAIESGDFKFIKHNPTNHEAFRTFEKELNKRYSKVERERVIRERSANLKKWDASLPERWRGASLSKIQNPAAQEALQILKERGKGSFFVYGDAGAGKTYLSYAIIRKYIGAGLTTFSQVKILSEESILGLAYTGFEGRSKFEKIFDSKYKVYLFDNVGERDTYDSKKETPLWERLIDHIYNNSLYAVFTSNSTASNFSEILSDSGQAKFSHLVSQRTIRVKGTRQPTLTDKEYSQKTNKAPITESEKLSAFDG